MDNEPKQRPQMAVALDETGSALYPAFRVMFLEELGERFEKLAEGRDTIPVAEVRELLKVEGLTSALSPAKN
jgi:hypothetical protein